ncbi:hypothetical protein IWW38_005573 [Coemansia aciculifera]|uniref:Uncharacterized protein n=1 Tax=Coemansia aciculifera TaxID=417176 RepID=A0ACC1LV91_9FUNG|nr:hypothetical protein IWW38_005573 [Coemansia aciculifera]
MGQSSSLQSAQLITATDAVCSVGASDWNGQNGRYVCTSYANTPNIGTCFGDSGGPLLLQSGSGYSLLGLVSFDVNTVDSSNTKCAQVGNVSYFTRVSSYLSYISSVTGISDSALVGGNVPWSHAADSSTSENSVSAANSSSSTTTSTTSTTTSSSTSSSTGTSTTSTTSNGNSSSSPSSTTPSGSNSKPTSSTSSSTSNGKSTAKSSDTSTGTDKGKDPQDASGASGSGSDSDSESSGKNSAAASMFRLVPASAVGLLVGVVVALF